MAEAEYDDEHDNEEDAPEVTEEHIKQDVADMNFLTGWLGELPHSETLMHCGMLGVAHGRIYSRTEEENDIDVEERDRMLEWLARLHADIKCLRFIMEQRVVATHRLGDYRPTLRRLTTEEQEDLEERMREDQEGNEE
jgi:hypothetical protein